jgi:hypothetical protein
MKWKPRSDRAYVHCYQENNVVLQIVGIVLILIGVVLLFLCIPGWAWAAVIGLALIIAGYLLIRFNSTWR